MPVQLDASADADDVDTTADKPYQDHAVAAARPVSSMLEFVQLWDGCPN